MRITIVLLLGASEVAVGLPWSTKPMGPSPRKMVKRFIPEARASHVDWNAPRGDGDFLAARPGLHSEAFFNSPREMAAAARRSSSAASSVFDANSAVSPARNLASEKMKRATPGQWENLRGTGYYKYHPAPVSWGGQRMDLFYMSKDKTCHYKNRDWGAKEEKYRQWGAWEDLGGDLDSAPAVCSRRYENMHVFCKGGDGQAWHRSYNNYRGGGGGWGKWQAMGGKMRYEPSSCSWGEDHAAVYVSATDGQCWTRRYYEPRSDAGQWYSWQNLGGYLYGPPKVITYGPGHQSVYCRGTDGQAWHKKTNPKRESGWGDWETLGGSLDSTPAACGWPDGRMDICVKGSDGACWHKPYKNETVITLDPATNKTTRTTLPGWGAWENLGGSMKSDTAPDVAVVDGGMEVYITGDDDAVYRKKWQNGSWSQNWQPMGGNVETQPAAVTWDNGKVDVYFTGKDGTCKRCF